MVVPSIVVDHVEAMLGFENGIFHQEVLHGSFRELRLEEVDLVAGHDDGLVAHLGNVVEGVVHAVAEHVSDGLQEPDSLISFRYPVLPSLTARSSRRLHRVSAAVPGLARCSAFWKRTNLTIQKNFESEISFKDIVRF